MGHKHSSGICYCTSNKNNDNYISKTRVLHKKNKSHQCSSMNNTTSTTKQTNYSCSDKGSSWNAVEQEYKQLNIEVSNVIQEGKCLLNSKYKIQTKLAHGATGTVYVGKNLITNQKVAIKLSEKKRTVIENIQLKNEIIFLKNLNHPNILRIFEFYETPTSFYMISELCIFGELFSRINKGFTEKELSVIMYQIFSALYYCHKNSIIHRDLKPENVLIDQTEKVIDEDTGKEIELCLVKLIDFGTAKIFVRNVNENTITGTSYYIAPEVLKKNYNEKCDMWSCGIILYLLLVGQPPFNGKNDNEIMTKIKAGKFHSDHPKFIGSSRECQDLIKSLLEVSIDKRLSAKQALMHDWFDKNKTMDLLRNVKNVNCEKYINNLKQYQTKSKFHVLMDAYLTHNNLNKDEQRDILKLLRFFDSTQEEKVNYRDFFNGLCKLMSPEEASRNVDDLFSKLDANNDNCIEYEELLRGMLSKDEMYSEEMMMLAFRFWDMNNTGKVDFKSMKETVRKSNMKVSDELLLYVFSEIKGEDNKNESEITFEMFKRYLMKK